MVGGGGVGVVVFNQQSLTILPLRSNGSLWGPPQDSLGLRLEAITSKKGLSLWVSENK